jgi:hypothetical protein
MLYKLQVMRRLVLLVFMALAGMSGFAQDTSGTCGENLTWELVNGTLTIRGTEGMTDYNDPNTTPWYSYREEITTVVMEMGVENIGAFAFFWSCNLTSVIIPESVTSVGAAAFEGCSSLESITLPETLTSIGYSAFLGCSSLESITLPESVTSIEHNAFYGCSSLVSIIIPEAITSISSWTFSRCSSLESITLPKTLISIGDCAFNGCSSLESITLPESLTSIGFDSTFSGCSRLTDVTVHWTTTPPVFYPFSNITLHIPFGTRAIYEAAEGWREFKIVEQPYSCSSGTFGTGDALTWELCEGVLTIRGTGAMPDFDNSDNPAPWYSYYENITAFILESGVRHIGYSAFNGCLHLASVALPETVTSIGDRAFYQCGSLVSITLPESVTSIGDRAFYGCGSLESIMIPSATSIGARVFSGCRNLTEITVASNNPYHSSEAGVLFDKNKTTLIQYPEGNVNNSYSIPASVTTIGNSAFRWGIHLESITIPASVTSIGDGAFYECLYLKSIAIPASTTYVPEDAFRNCTSLTEITVASNNPACSSEDGVLFNKNKTTLMQYPARKAGDSYTVPETVTFIAEYAFQNCGGLTSVHFSPSSLLTGIGQRGFSGCSNLKSIVLPESVISIEESAFGWCSSLESIVIPEKITSIERYTFYGCNSLESVTPQLTLNVRELEIRNPKRVPTIANFPSKASAPPSQAERFSS